MNILKNKDLVEGVEVPMNTLINDDCLNAMAFIPDGSISAIICDPPYEITDCEWDSIIPLEPMWAQLKRVIKPNGAIVMTASQPFTTTLIASNMKMFKYCWVWEKSKASNFQLAKHNPMKIHEDVCVFYKKKTYYPQMEWVGIKDKRKTFTERKAKFPHISSGKTLSHSKDNGYRYPKSIIKVNNSDTTGAVHPTQKPVALMEYLIKTYTNPTETVLDFAMGSGTTGVACVNLGRDFIGIELDDDYFSIASGRIEEAQMVAVPPQMDLFVPEIDAPSQNETAKKETP